MDLPLDRTARRGRYHRFGGALAFCTVFLSGFNPALPNRGWAVPVQVVHAVFLDNLLAILSLAGMVLIPGLALRVPRNARAVPFAGLVALLGAIGVLSAGVNPTRIADLGEAGRVVLFGAYVLLIVHWTRTREPTFILRAFLLGITAGALANLYFSFTQPYLLIGFFPALRSRNVAGGFVGIAVCLGAWLMLVRRNRFDAFVALAASAVGLFASGVSFSKTAMTIAGCGLVAWGFYLLHAIVWRRSRAAIVVAAALVLSFASFAPLLQQSKLGQTVGESLAVKFDKLSLSDRGSSQERYQYLWGVLEIAIAHPLLGVSPSGFYDAIVQTERYRSGVMAEEDPAARTEGSANPHNTFLYYLAAGGFSGFVVALLIFGASLRAIYRTVSQEGVGARLVWGAVSLGYIIYGATLPNMLTTAVLYVPAAVAFALHARQAHLAVKRDGPSVQV